MMGEDADRADRGPRRDHLDFVVEHLPFRRQDLEQQFGYQEAAAVLVGWQASDSQVLQR